jgi:16S rRNA (guanine1207-N2)-methyltransferase
MSDSPGLDKSVGLLLQKLPDLAGNILLVADENWSQAHWSGIKNSGNCHLVLISNRFDIAAEAEAAGIDSQFSDFDFSALAQHSFDAVLFRVSKERANSHYVINQAVQLLKPGAELWLSGEKKDGVKTYTKHACKRFGDSSNAAKHGICYLAPIKLQSADTSPLDDKNYTQIRPIKTQHHSQTEYLSKPGIFGWDKTDRGSAFLIDHLPQFLNRYHTAPKSLLDLGCGYGYLSCEASQYGFSHISGTDNNAAALIAAEKNFQRLLHVDYQVIAADVGDQLDQRFETILCNPPFHQGFAMDDDLGVRFLQASKRLLATAGQALFVVNTFIPLEHKAKPHFAQVNVLANNGSFKLVALSQ